MDLLHNWSLSLAAAAEEGGIGWNIFFYSALVIAIVLAFASLARKGLKGHVYSYLPTRLAEQLYLFLEGMALNVIGPSGRKYVPFLLALWTFIFAGNVMGLILQATPTADWSLNLGMALITVIYVQYEGIKQNGVWGHIKHFAGPKMVGAMVLISGMLFMIEIVSECMKLVSLSLRLFGNIEGGHIVITSLNSIIPGIPLGGLLLPIKLFTCVIQAFVWVILTCTYLAMVTSHGDDESHGAEEGHGGGHHGATEAVSA